MKTDYEELNPLCKFRNLIDKKYKDRNSRIDLTLLLVEIFNELSVVFFYCCCVSLFEFVIVVV